MPLFSIAIPTYNGGQTIGRLLKSLSLVSDNYTKELIVMDSGSYDNTLKIVDKYKKFFTKTKIITIQQENFNHGLTRNLMVKEARGKYICFFSQDACLLNKEMFQILLEDFQRYQKVVAVFGPHVPYEESPFIQQLEVICRWERFREVLKDQNVWVQNRENGLVPLTKDTETLWYTLSNTAACYLRSFLLKNLFPNTEYGEDMLLGKKMIEKGHTKIYDEKCAVKHSHRYNLMEYYRREKEDLKLRFQKVGLQEKPRLVCKVKRILALPIGFLYKAKLLSELSVYYTLKLIIILELRLRPVKNENTN